LYNKKPQETTASMSQTTANWKIVKRCVVRNTHCATGHNVQNIEFKIKLTFNN